MPNSEFMAGVMLISVLILGSINAVLVPLSFVYVNKLLYRVTLILFVLAAMTMCFFMLRAGIVADETGISGNQVWPFYGSEWIMLLAIGAISLIFQIVIWLKHKSRRTR